MLIRYKVEDFLSAPYTFLFGVIINLFKVKVDGLIFCCPCMVELKAVITFNSELLCLRMNGPNF